MVRARSSQKLPARLEPHLANQGTESRHIPQSIEDRVHLQIDQPVVTVLKCAFQPFDSARTLAQPSKNHCLAVFRRIAYFGKSVEASNDSSCFRGPSGNSVHITDGTDGEGQRAVARQVQRPLDAGLSFLKPILLSEGHT